MQNESNSKVFVFDTTLRDGEQAPGCSMSLREKLKIAHALNELNVDVIEAGFAAASPGDFESLKLLHQKLMEQQFVAWPAVIHKISRRRRKQ